MIALWRWQHVLLMLLMMMVVVIAGVARRDAVFLRVRPGGVALLCNETP